MCLFARDQLLQILTLEPKLGLIVVVEVCCDEGLKIVLHVVVKIRLVSIVDVVHECFVGNISQNHLHTDIMASIMELRKKIWLHH